MWLRLTMDEDMLIVASEAVIEHGPFAICPDGAQHFGRLVGLVIRPGFLREATARVAGTDGCTHLRELLQQVATTAYQTLWPVRMRRATEHRRAAGAPQGAPAAAQHLLRLCRQSRRGEAALAAFVARRRTESVDAYPAAFGMHSGFSRWPAAKAANSASSPSRSATSSTRRR